VVFKDPGNLDGEVVHLHLEHRVVQRLLGRFLSQGFRDDDLRRACVLRTVEAQPRAVLLGRLSLFGEGGARLHDEVLAAAPSGSRSNNGGRLRPLGRRRQGRRAEARRGGARPAPAARGRVHAPGAPARPRGPATWPSSPPTSSAAPQGAGRARRPGPHKRGDTEARDMAAILEAQRERIEARQQEIAAEARQGRLGFNPDEERQLAADQRYWVDRLQSIARELEAEPDRVRKSYVVKATRVEAVGIVYLWPLSS
jgi:hypothetical protein